MDHIFKLYKFLLLLLLFLLSIRLEKFKIKKEIYNNKTNFDTNSKVIFTKDILFINGCNPRVLPHPYRYRVLHQIEQLQFGFLDCDKYFYLKFNPNIVRYYRIIIFFRCPWIKKIGKAISLAKRLNKKVLFDIDDLIIDTKYTDIIPYLNSLTKIKKQKYDNTVKRIKKTLKHCDGAITTTETLARELKHYVPTVFINHNVASEKMWSLSQEALSLKNLKGKDGHVVIGYFSGSFSHNPDIEMIKPVLYKILKEYKQVQILLFGLISSNDLYNEFPSQIIFKKFTDWMELPKIISNIDINIAPIENLKFNWAKSENKWVEAALVKVPTIASNYGQFKRVIKHNETGLLCSNLNDWYLNLKSLINNEVLRRIIGENAYEYCRKEYNTLYNHNKLVNFINLISPKHIGFFLPSLKISGEVYVVLKHAIFLQDEGWDVDIIIPNNNFINTEITLFDFEGHKLNLLILNRIKMLTRYDIVVATLYSTLYDIITYYKAKYHFYLVQNYETDFLQYDQDLRIKAEKTYSIPYNIKYITISKWCQNWLLKNYNQNSSYAPNGIDFNNTNYYMRNFKNRKIRILIEGDSSSFYKNVDESFKIVEKLDKNLFEIWYLSNDGKPKYWYYIDKFFHKIPHEKIIKIYYECDILLKSSWLESFSYPPLEMMSTGGYSIVVPNEGNKEYLQDKRNCLLYKLGDINDAIKNIQLLISDRILQRKLYINGVETAKKRDWKNFRNQVIHLYDI